MGKMDLREADSGDAELLFAWANDMDVRRNAFHQQDIGWEEHKAWFAGKLRDAACVIYIAWEEDAEGRPVPVGQIRLDIAEGRAEIDYSVALEKRGRGRGSEMLRQAMQRAPKAVTEFYARVKAENAASARVFEKCGFQKLRESRGILGYRRRRVNTEAMIQAENTERKRVVICTQKSWNEAFAKELLQRQKDKYDIYVITEKEELCPERLEEIKPAYVFFPHWSYRIPESIYKPYTCVVFHMTDLPFGRGGSPLQNLIVRGIGQTRICALRVEEELDAGDIYLKEELSLEGSAEEILKRASEIIFHRMIPCILEEEPTPVPQSGEPVIFKRRKPEDGKLLPGMELKTVYDYIRMLDGEGYPNAYLELGDMKLRFSDASFADGRVRAQVIFEKKTT